MNQVEFREIKCKNRDFRRIRLSIETPWLNFAFFLIFPKGLLSSSQEDAVKNCIDKLNNLLMCATKKRPDGPPSVLSGTESENSEKDKLKAFLAETLAKQLVLRDMKDITEYELHKIVFAIATKTSLDDGNLCPPPAYPPLPSPPPPQQPPAGGYDYYNQGFNNSGTVGGPPT